MKILDDGTIVFETPAEEADHQPSWEEERLPWEIQACKFFVETGNISATARRFSTTPYEIKKLMQKVWWQDEVTSLKQQMRTRSEASFSRIVDKSLALLEDRLDNGEIIKVKEDAKTGEKVITRAPMKSTDIARIADMAFMKRQLIRNEPTTIPGSTEALSTLARKLQALGAKDPSLLEAPTEDRHRDATGIEDIMGDDNGED